MVRRNGVKMIIAVMLFAGIMSYEAMATGEDAYCTPICSECSGCIDQGCCPVPGACGGNECVKISEDSCRCFTGGA